jgi:hypothetical protein|tara:strand:- start:1834 stop:2265 length:432 start_codon:yes stop_codon:yes gene_type:complete
MPKPILSDSLFNADDVATAILNEANLQIANSNLQVVNRTSLFSPQNGYTVPTDTSSGAYSFNGFMFVNFRLEKTGSDSTSACFIITDSNFYPSVLTTMPTISHEGDRANYVEFDTNGNVNVSIPSDQGGDTFHVIINGWYRYA